MIRRLSAILGICLILTLSSAMTLGSHANKAYAIPGASDWHFLFVIYPYVDADYQVAGKTWHTTHSMTTTELDYAQTIAKDFQDYMNSLGIINAHVDVVTAQFVITELGVYGEIDPKITEEQSASLLAAEGIDLDRYDHICNITSLDVKTSYLGLGGTSYENKTGWATINLVNEAYVNQLWEMNAGFHCSTAVHEFLHFMEQYSQKWGGKFHLHETLSAFYSWSTNDEKKCYTDLLLNHARGNLGTGIPSGIWKLSPVTIRTGSDLIIPYGIQEIGAWSLNAHYNIANVYIPTSVTRIGYAAFCNSEVQDVYYQGTEEQWEAIILEDYNESLLTATVHYKAQANFEDSSPYSSTGTWIKDSSGWWYRYSDGSYPFSCWRLINDKWYHFNKQGYAETGWFNDNGAWYYFDQSGNMKTKWLYQGGVWYYLLDSGVMATNTWINDGGNWYYILSSGVMAANRWLIFEDERYYVDSSGAMLIGWQSIDGKWYYFKSSGTAAIGWSKVGSTWYYHNNSGVMLTGWHKIGGVWYYLKSSGAMAKGWNRVEATWYYHDSSGAMKTGWQKIDEAWYYLEPNGAMAANTVIDGYRIGTDGKWIYS